MNDEKPACGGFDDSGETVVGVAETHENWLQITAREYGLSVDELANELLRYGLIHHEEVIGEH